MKLAIISFGPIESRSNGYFTRIWHLANQLSKKNQLLILQFSQNSFIIKDEIPNTKLINLTSNKPSKGFMSKLSKKLLGFDIFQIIKFQVLVFTELKKHRKEILECDAVLIEGGLLIPAFILSKKLKKKIIFDTHCINTILAESYRGPKKLIFFMRGFIWSILEKLEFRGSDIIIVVSEYEKNYLIHNWNIDNKKIMIIPNVVDTSRRLVSENEKIALKGKLGLEDKLIVSFIGDFNAIQNKESANYIITQLAPFFLTHNKKIFFLCVGKGKNNFLSYPENILFTDYVDDLDLYIQISDLCIAPLTIGAGTKTKILDYLANNKSIITTLKGMEGIPFQSEGIIVCELHEFSSKIAEFFAKGPQKNEDHLKFIDAQYRLFVDSIKSFEVKIN